MRWLLCLALLVDASASWAREKHPMRECKRGAWDAVVKCLATTNVKPQITLQQGNARVVTLFHTVGGRNIGALLYVQRDGEWHLDGRFEAFGVDDYRVLAVSSVVVGKKPGHRLDVVIAVPFTMTIDGMTHVSALMRLRKALFCNGRTYDCVQTVNECDISVDGKTWFFYRGTIAYEDNVAAVTVTGDKSRAGPHCTYGPPRATLGW